MTTFAGVTWRTAIVGRWMARIVGTLMALFFLAFVVGEGPPPIFKLGWHQNLLLLGMAGLFFGLLLAWKWARLGGLVALAGFGLLIAIDRRFNTTWLFLLPAATGALSLLCGWRMASGPPASGVAWEVPRRALWIAGAVIGVFILLCANEMLGEPPLMTPALRPSTEMVGQWQGDFYESGSRFAVAFLISSDGTVSGHIGDTTVTGGRIRNNRSWFGNLMHWREPYEIRGQGFTAGAAIRGRNMRAFVSFAGSPIGWEATLRKQ
jgi:hypothetical protein